MEHVPEGPALQQLLDKLEIHEVLMRYCRAIDRCDEELLRSVYHPDATDNHGSFNGTAADFVPWVMDLLRRRFRSTTHAICNELIDLGPAVGVGSAGPLPVGSPYDANSDKLLAGEVAHVEAYFFAFHRYDRDGGEYDWTVAGRYIDRFERRSGLWKIAHRLAVTDWDRVDPVSGQRPLPAVVGVRSRQDPVYRR